MLNLYSEKKATKDQEARLTMKRRRYEITKEIDDEHCLIFIIVKYTTNRYI